MSKTNALILIGGQSQRLGMEKAKIIYHEKPQFAYLYDLLTNLGLETYLSCNQYHASQYQKNYPVIVDNYQHIGPIGGVAAAFANIDSSQWLVIACDMPFINENTIKKLLNCKQTNKIITYKAADKPFPEVLLTLYKQNVRPLILDAVKEKSYSLQSILKKANAYFIPPESMNEIFNVNTPEDLALAKKILAQSN